MAINTGSGSGMIFTAMSGVLTTTTSIPGETGLPIFMDAGAMSMAHFSGFQKNPGVGCLIIWVSGNGIKNWAGSGFLARFLLRPGLIGNSTLVFIAGGPGQCWIGYFMITMGRIPIIFGILEG